MGKKKTLALSQTVQFKLYDQFYHRFVQLGKGPEIEGANLWYLYFSSILIICTQLWASFFIIILLLKSFSNNVANRRDFMRQQYWMILFLSHNFFNLISLWAISPLKDPETITVLSQCSIAGTMQSSLIRSEGICLTNTLHLLSKS